MIGLPSSIVYELRFDRESREWADENAPAVVQLVGRYFDISGSEVDPEFAKVDRGKAGPIEIDVRFTNGTVVRLLSDTEESVYSAIHRAAATTTGVSFRDAVDVKAADDSDDLASTGLTGISSPLEVMRPSRKAAEDLELTLQSLQSSADSLRSKLQASSDVAGAGRSGRSLGGSMDGIDRMMGWDRLRKLEMTIRAGHE